jgi:nucleoid-associated protein YgaU
MMNSRHDIIIILLLGLALTLPTGCAKKPMTELESARAAVAQAYSAGAPDYAAAEYQAAKAALDNAEQLSNEGKFEAARDILPFAEAQARQAAGKARENRARLEKERLIKIQEEKHRKQEAEAQKRREKKHVAEKKTTATVKPEPPKPIKLYTVQPEETLPQIAARQDVYGDQALWPLLYKANRDQITDPRKIYPGQELTVPRNATQEELDAARSEAAESSIFPLVQDAVSKD